MSKKYHVNDRKLLLTLEPAEEGGYVVSSTVVVEFASVLTHVFLQTTSLHHDSP